MELCMLCLPCNPCNSGIVSIGINTLYVLVMTIIVVCVIICFAGLAFCVYRGLFPKHQCLEERLNAQKLINQIIDRAPNWLYENSYIPKTIMEILSKIEVSEKLAESEISRNKEVLDKQYETIEAFIKEVKDKKKDPKFASVIDGFNIDEFKNSYDSIKEKHDCMVNKTLDTYKETQKSIILIKELLRNG